MTKIRGTRINDLIADECAAVDSVLSTKATAALNETIKAELEEKDPENAEEILKGKKSE